MSSENLKKWILCDNCLSEKITKKSSFASDRLKHMALDLVKSSKNDKKDWTNPLKKVMLMDDLNVCPSCKYKFEHTVLGGATKKT